MTDPSDDPPTTTSPARDASRDSQRHSHDASTGSSIDAGDAAGDAADAEAPNPSDPAQPTRPGRDPSTIRMAKPSGTAPDASTIPVHRLRALPGHGGELTPVDGPGRDGDLVFPEGGEGEAERALGRADTTAALAIAENAATTNGPAGEMADWQRTVRVRAHLMEGAIDEAHILLKGRRDDDAMLLADAALCLADGEVQRADQKAQRALQLRPRGVGEHYLLALVRVAEGRMQEALDDLALVAKSAPDHAVARYQLGQLLLAGGDPARAGTLFEMAWQIAPQFVAPAMALAEMLAESRQLGDALALLGAVCDAAPTALSPRLLQLKVLLELGEKDAAIGLASALHEKLPDDADVALLWAEALLEAERKDEARAAASSMLGALPPSYEQRARRLLARIALAERPPRVDEALDQLQRAASLLPGAGELHVEIVHVAMAAGRRPDAEAALESLAADAQSEVGTLLSGAILARSHGLWPQATRLGAAARARVVGTPAEAQLEAFLATLPGT